MIRQIRCIQLVMFLTMKSPTVTTRSAFTVPELLAVVAIITIIISTLLPSLNHGRDVARAAICMGNVRQISVAHTGYKVSHLGWHPPTSVDNTQRHWLELLEDYHDTNDSVRFCPSVKGGYLLADPNNTSLNQVWGSRNHHWWLNKNTYGVTTSNGGSYGANSWLHSTTGWGQNLALHFRRASLVDRPASLIPVLSESVWHNGFPKHTDTSLVKESHGSEAPGGMMNRVLIPRHFGKANNVGFYDGSARQVELPRMWSLVWNNAFVTKETTNVAWLK